MLYDRYNAERRRSFDRRRSRAIAFHRLRPCQISLTMVHNQENVQMDLNVSLKLSPQAITVIAGIVCGLIGLL